MIDFSDNLGRHLSVTWRRMNAMLARKLEPFGIGAGQYPYLFVLFVEDGQSQQSLANRMAMDKAAVMRAVGKLIKEGYVKRIQDEKDRRAYRVFLTPKARKIRPALERAAEEVLETLQGGMNGDERASAAALLKRMADNLMG